MVFDAPSDFVPEGKPRNNMIWKVLGGGCLVLLLVVGGLFAAGAFKAVKCCSDVSGMVQRTMASSMFAKEWAGLLASQEYGEAYSKLTPRYKQQTSQSVFEEQVAPYTSYLEGGGHSLGMNVLNVPDFQGNPAWRHNYQFVEQNSVKALVVSFDVLGSDDGFGVENVTFELQERVFSEEPAAKAVIEFHDLVSVGKDDIAFARLSEGFKENADLEAFGAFLSGEGAVLKGPRLEIRDVSYNSESSATVLAAVEGESRRAVVQFELVMEEGLLWKIATISPLLGTLAPEDTDGTGMQIEGAVELEDVE